MKTAISIPDAVFAEAEEFAKRRGLSRSELYARAVKEYLKSHRREGVTEKLNEIYGSEPEGEVDDFVKAAQANFFKLPDKW